MSHVQLARVELVFNLAIQLILIFLGILHLYVISVLRLKTAHYSGDLLGSDRKLMIESILSNFVIRIVIVSLTV